MVIILRWETSHQLTSDHRGTDGVAQWGAQYGNSWRTTDDIYNGQDAVTYNIVANDVDAEYAAPGGWNDPDMVTTQTCHRTSHDPSSWHLTDSSSYASETVGSPLD